MMTAIKKEIDIRATELATSALDSIYFGGGTPSLLDREDLDMIFGALSTHFTWDQQTEITLEANPDDLTDQKLKQLSSTEVNRLSIGVQSFHDEDLSYMNRAHDASEAHRCITAAQDVGFDAISADLIYGVPTSDDNRWRENIHKILSYDIDHISAYALTVEEGTALHHFIAQGKSEPVDDNVSSRQFDILIDRLEDSGYIHYEISNFAKPDSYAIHNSNYWLGQPYLGLGPSAHSFDGAHCRSWNIAHNARYIKILQQGHLPLESEVLTSVDAFNEYILIRLRTIWGIDRKDIVDQWPECLALLDDTSAKFISDGYMAMVDNKYTLTRRGKHLGDKISMELFAEVD